MLAGSCEFQSVLMFGAVLEKKVSHVEVAVDDGEGERGLVGKWKLNRRPVV